MHIVQPMSTNGEAKLINPLTEESRKTAQCAGWRMSRSAGTRRHS